MVGVGTGHREGKEVRTGSVHEPDNWGSVSQGPLRDSEHTT